VGTSVKVALRQQRQELLYWLLVGLIFGIGSSIILGYGGYLVYRDQFVLKLASGGMTVGQLLVFMWYLNGVYGPLQAISGAGVNIQGGVAGARRVFEVLDRDPVISDATDAVHLARQPRTLDLDRVSFEYRAGEPVLQDITVSVRPGEMVAFVGSSGVGKTTLLNLLPRFYDPTAGRLLLDGQDVRRVKIPDLRRHVALVLQDSVVLPTTIAENIAYGRPGATIEQIEHAARRARVHRVIARLPDGYATRIGERGVTLSGGQRQCIAIARAMICNAPILIMDEPTAGLDDRSRARVMKALRRLMRGRTIVVITHDPRNFAGLDRIVLLQDGRIAGETVPPAAGAGPRPAAAARTRGSGTA
jgi:subfamily B ATP-binding cassette protein MsbA